VRLSEAAGTAVTWRLPNRMDDYVLVRVDVAAADAAWRRNSGFYIGRGGTGNTISDRYARFKKWLDDHPATAIEAPNCSISPNGILQFGDGRHRFAVLRDLGYTEIMLAFPEADVDRARRLIGTGVNECHMPEVAALREHAIAAIPADVFAKALERLAAPRFDDFITVDVDRQYTDLAYDAPKTAIEGGERVTLNIMVSFLAKDGELSAKKEKLIRDFEAEVVAWAKARGWWPSRIHRMVWRDTTFGATPVKGLPDVYRFEVGHRPLSSAYAPSDFPNHVLYYIAPTTAVPSILTRGIIPKTGGKIETYPPRVYLADDKKRARELAEVMVQKGYYKWGELAVFEIDLAKVNRQANFYPDEDMDGGWFTLTHIPARAITMLKPKAGTRNNPMSNGKPLFWDYREPIEEMSQGEMMAAERDIDALLAPFGLDAAFTAHFKERLEGREESVTPQELVGIFRKLVQQRGRLQEWGKGSKSVKACLTDITTALNIPVVVEVDPVSGHEDLVLLTVMRKKGFKIAYGTARVVV
jgi:hypothetical protein